MRRRVLVPALVAGAVLAPVAAYGFWTVGSTGVNGATRAGSLGPPTVSSMMSNGDVRISVTSPPATGPRPTSYLVHRTAPTAAANVCTITPAADGTGSCIDTSPVVGQQNTYQVVGRLQNWRALGPSVLTTSVDVGLLTTNITAVAASTNVVAGNVLNVTATARTLAGIPDVSFNGTKTVLVTGAPNSPNGTAATVPVTASFTLGIATIPVTLVKAGSTTLTVSAAGLSANTAAVTVAPAAASTYALAGPSTAQAGVAYTLASVTAVDAYGNTATTASGSRVLAWSGAGTAPNGASPTASTSASFTSGVATNVALTFVKAESAQLKATTGSVTTPTTLAVTVSGGLPANAGFTGMSSPTLGVVTCPTTISCTGTALGNDGAVAGQIVLTDAYGNAAGNAGAGYQLQFTAAQSKGSGAFTTGGSKAATRTVTVPSTGSSAVTWSYAHNGEADWDDVLTIRLIKDGTTVHTITAKLHKTSP